MIFQRPIGPVLCIIILWFGKIKGFHWLRTISYFDHGKMHGGKGMYVQIENRALPHTENITPLPFPSTSASLA